jgi:hypothetical protein
VVEGARLESVYTGNRIEGSNPSVSAEGDKSTKNWFAPSLFSITLADLLAIMANMEFTFSVRNSS